MSTFTYRLLNAVAGSIMLPCRAGKSSVGITGSMTHREELTVLGPQ